MTKDQKCRSKISRLISFFQRSFRPAVKRANPAIVAATIDVHFLLLVRSCRARLAMFYGWVALVYIFPDVYGQDVGKPIDIHHSRHLAGQNVGKPFT